jgi:hypothetical protein
MSELSETRVECGRVDRAHFVGGATSMTGESELEREVKYLMADDRSTERDLMGMSWSLF